MIANLVRKLLSIPPNEPFSATGFIATAIFIAFMLLFIFLKH